MDLVDRKGIEALKKVGLDRLAVGLAEAAREAGAFDGTSTFGFLEEDEKATGEFLVELTIRVKRA